MIKDKYRRLTHPSNGERLFILFNLIIVISTVIYIIAALFASVYNRRISQKTRLA